MPAARSSSPGSIAGVTADIPIPKSTINPSVAARALAMTAGVFGCVAVDAAQAVKTPSTGPTVDVSGVLQMMLSLALVVALIVGLSWAIGRLRRVQRTHTGPLAIAGELVVGPKERVILVRVGDAQALVGVGSAGVTSLSLLDRPVQLGQTAADTATFAQRLREIMNRPGSAK